MRVAVYYNNSDVRLEELPKPQIGQGELLLRIEASGICGSDVMEWYRIKKAPLVLGHEIAGEIIEVGKDVKRYKKGDRVSASHHVPCNTCHYCLTDRHTVCDTLRSTNFDPGGFAEFVRLPAINVDRGVYPLPNEVSYEEGTFIEPVACVLRAQRIARLRPGQSVLVVGSGMTGLLQIYLARAFGAGRIMATDISQYRLDTDLRFGAEAVIHAGEDVPGKVRELNCGRLADVVFVCTGAVSAIHQALDSVERGGTVLLFAPTDPGVKIPLDVTEMFFRNGVTLTSSYAGSPADHMTAVELLRSGTLNVRDMITHRLPLAETGKGFKLVADAKESMKVIIEPQK
ncbi:MAG: alcohol dehydrogenase [Candidatus Abyssobacteria bacterium SURF_17]|jgi:L-iditol 2-dehydrogenase|uniref:Alcohol dehydrogenase n=1 Tax=Candidatus Abyssobacteria bacterium SURF_17 TaxID=2093361 RepID=A0A419EWH1_9BACT|nr:MAG: alcohol dehydrogenase [Candidatus Abyssubacteria bacterium SURF_17]